MVLIKRFSIFLFVLFTYISCQKSIDTPTNRNNGIDTLGGGTVPVVYDSIKVLSGTYSSNGTLRALKFEYDSLNRLRKVLVPTSWTTPDLPYSISYTNGKVSSILSEDATGLGLPVKGSVIFEYGSNSKISKAYYKPPTNLYNNVNNAPYFTSISDEKYEDKDSIIYSSTDQILQIYEMHKYYGWKVARVIRFYYPSSSDSIATKIEEHRYDTNGTLKLYDQLLITTNNIDNPVYRSVPYSVYIRRLGIVMGSGYGFPFLIDGPSTQLGQYLAFVPKCISNYKVYNDWGFYNYTNSIFDYSYSTDSLQLLMVKRTDPYSVNMTYQFTKFRKR